MLSSPAKTSSMLSSVATLIDSNFFGGRGGRVLALFTCGSSKSFFAGAALVLVLDSAAVEEV